MQCLKIRGIMCDRMKSIIKSVNRHPLSPRIQYKRSLNSACCAWMSSASQNCRNHLKLPKPNTSDDGSPPSCIPFPAVYVVSRIGGISDFIFRNCVRILSHGVDVYNIEIPDDTDILDKEQSDQVHPAEVAVIDPCLLAANYDKMPNLKWVYSTWAGVECLFTAMASEPLFKISRHASEEFCTSMAEFVMGHVLSCERQFKEIWKNQEKRKWVFMDRPYLSLKELTLGVLGVGNMGCMIAKVFKPHGTKLIGLARTRQRDTSSAVFDEITLSLQDILDKSDYIVNTLPSTKETTGMLNGRTLMFCRKNPVFINVGRGSIINDESLVIAITCGWIRGAVLDVFHKEPLPASSPLWNVPDVTITPHCAAISRSDHVAEGFLKAFLCYEEKLPLPNLVDWKAQY